MFNLKPKQSEATIFRGHGIIYLILFYFKVSIQAVWSRHCVSKNRCVAKPHIKIKNREKRRDFQEMTGITTCYLPYTRYTPAHTHRVCKLSEPVLFVIFKQQSSLRHVFMPNTLKQIRECLLVILDR